MSQVSQKQVLNNAIAKLQDRNRRIRWLEKQVRDLLEVAENAHYALQHGDWDILEAADRGAVRLLKRHGRFNQEDDA